MQDRRQCRPAIYDTIQAYRTHDSLTKSKPPQVQHYLPYAVCAASAAASTFFSSWAVFTLSG